MYTIVHNPLAQDTDRKIFLDQWHRTVPSEVDVRSVVKARTVSFLCFRWRKGVGERRSGVVLFLEKKSGLIFF